MICFFRIRYGIRPLLSPQYWQLRRACKTKRKAKMQGRKVCWVSFQPPDSSQILSKRLDTNQFLHSPMAKASACWYQSIGKNVRDVGDEPADHLGMWRSKVKIRRRRRGNRRRFTSEPLSGWKITHYTSAKLSWKYGTTFSNWSVDGFWKIFIGHQPRPVLLSLPSRVSRKHTNSIASRKAVSLVRSVPRPSNKLKTSRIFQAPCAFVHPEASVASHVEVQVVLVIVSQEWTDVVMNFRVSSRYQ